MPNVVPATQSAINRAGVMLREGGLVAFPTETVYGLGANALDATAVARIFEAKKRPHFDPLIVHVAHVSELPRVAVTSDAAHRLIEGFWPGALTIIFEKTSAVPGIVTSGLSTVAVRVPDHEIARTLIEVAGVPVAAPSANPFGFLSPTSAQHVADGLGDSVDLILDGGATPWGVESTIVSVAGSQVSVLRLGAVSVEDLEQVVGPVAFATSVVDFQAQVPGQLAQHYSPNTHLRLVEAGVPVDDGGAYLALYEKPVGVFDAIEILSPSGDLREAAANLFEYLHRLDEAGHSIITAELAPEKGLGRAINDRLKRAAARH